MENTELVTILVAFRLLIWKPINQVSMIRSHQKDSKGLTKETVTDIYQDESGIVWVVLWGGGLAKFSLKISRF